MSFAVGTNITRHAGNGRPFYSCDRCGWKDGKKARAKSHAAKCQGSDNANQAAHTAARASSSKIARAAGTAYRSKLKAGASTRRACSALSNQVRDAKATRGRVTNAEKGIVPYRGEQDTGRLARSVMGSDRPKSLGHFLPIKAAYESTAGQLQVDVLRSLYHEKFPAGPPDQDFFTELEDYIASTAMATSDLDAYGEVCQLDPRFDVIDGTLGQARANNTCILFHTQTSLVS